MHLSLLQVVIVCCLAATLSAAGRVAPNEAAADWSNETIPCGVHHNRDRRYVLSFPINGGVAKVLFGFVAPVRFHHMLKRSLNLGINLQANYRILPNIIFPHPESVWKNRYDPEAYVDTGRKQLYALLEKFLGTGGQKLRAPRACLLRTICEVADTPLTHNGMVGELLDMVFSPGDTDDLPDEYKMARKYGANGVNCGRLYDECPFGHGILDTTVLFVPLQSSSDELLLSPRMDPFRWVSMLVLLTCAVCCAFAESDSSAYFNASQTLSRRKRTLIFHPISRGFFRVNIKDAIADNSTIWAQGIGFRMNIEFYNPPGLKITRRDVHQSVESMIMSHGFDGRACILRTFCEISKVMTPKSGILFKLFKLIFRLPEGDDKYFPYLSANDCKELDRHCPITQLDMDQVDPVSSEAYKAAWLLEHPFRFESGQSKVLWSAGSKQVICGFQNTKSGDQKLSSQYEYVSEQFPAWAWASS
uniref:Uncharacterized protein n=1 Tax=Anopheles dirus TaxID=7168 RepID=A0A182NDU8_9DIPT